MGKRFFRRGDLEKALNQLRDGSDEARVECLTAIEDALSFNVDPSTISQFRDELENAQIMHELRLTDRADATKKTNVDIAVRVHSILVRVDMFEGFVRWYRTEQAVQKIGRNAKVYRHILTLLLHNKGLRHSALRERMIPIVRGIKDSSLRRYCTKLGRLKLVEIRRGTTIGYNITWLGEAVLERLEASGA